MLESYDLNDEIDMLILPELSFCGSTFQNA